MGFCKLCLDGIHYPSTCQQCFRDPISHLPSIGLTRIRALSEHLLNGASLKKLPQPGCTSACKSDETAVATGWGVLKSWCPLSLEHIAYYSDLISHTLVCRPSASARAYRQTYTFQTQQKGMVGLSGMAGRSNW